MNRRLFWRLALGLAVLAAVSASLARAAVVQENYAQRTVFGYTTSGVYDPADNYQINGYEWVAHTMPAHPENLARGGTVNFLNVLQAAFTQKAGWTFVTAPKDLTANSLRVHTYNVYGANDGVGAEFDIEYVPGEGDPTDNIHWIQVVTDNHNITDANPKNQGHGKAENIVDINLKLNNFVNPYYDNGFAGDSRNLYDFAGREPENPHTWTAELYLVSGPNAAGEVTIWNGVRWGWENHMVPEPSTYMLMATALAALAITNRRRSRRRQNPRQDE